MRGRIEVIDWALLSRICRDFLHAQTLFHLTTFLLDRASPGYAQLRRKVEGETPVLGNYALLNRSARTKRKSPLTSLWGVRWPAFPGDPVSVSFGKNEEKNRSARIGKKVSQDRVLLKVRNLTLPGDPANWTGFRENAGVDKKSGFLNKNYVNLC